MGCEVGYGGASFTTYTDANQDYWFTGYYQSKPYYVNASGFILRYEEMDNEWIIVGDLEEVIYYSDLDTECPPGEYRLKADDSLEGDIT